LVLGLINGNFDLLHIIAHELGHIYKNHAGVLRNEQYKPEDEIEADTMALQWGFARFDYEAKGWSKEKYIEYVRYELYKLAGYGISPDRVPGTCKTSD